MLDTFEIVTTSGVVLWSRSYAPVNPSIIDSFIADTFIEEKSGNIATFSAQSASTNPPYKSDQHTLKWTLVKELGVIFVVSLLVKDEYLVLNSLDPEPPLLTSRF
jgi:signal recognition particle receptor subunit alpha